MLEVLRCLRNISERPQTESWQPGYRCRSEKALLTAVKKLRERFLCGTVTQI